MQNLANCSQLIYLVISFHLLSVGVWFDSIFSFCCHVKSTGKASFVHVKDLKRLTGYFACDAALLAANALAESRQLL